MPIATAWVTRLLCIPEDPVPSTFTVRSKKGTRIIGMQPFIQYCQQSSVHQKSNVHHLNILWTMQHRSPVYCCWASPVIVCNLFCPLARIFSLLNLAASALSPILTGFRRCKTDWQLDLVLDTTQVRKLRSLRLYSCWARSVRNLGSSCTWSGP